MLQRIQSVYLIVASVLSLCSMALDLFATKELIIKASAHTALLIAGSLMIAETVAPIFLFKNRGLQKRICYMAILMQLFFLIVLLVTVYKQVPRGLSGVQGFQIASIFPLINSILIYLAIRGINKDDELIRSMDRLR
ncbi:MAG: DUF4293 domain-containing protein [Bacteroidota bacterium]